MSSIFTPPLGLLSFLGTKAVGQNPDQLEQVVRPVLDLTSFYSLWETQAQASGVLAAPSEGAQSTAAITIPEGELWRLRAFSLSNCVADGPCSIGLAIANPGGQLVWFSEYYATAGPSLYGAYGQVFPQDLTLYSSWRILPYILDTSTNVEYTLGVVFNRIRL